ncbi:MAG: phosphoribosylanthranilate isomerase [Eubacterium sp.]|nr:phosphoribosylanthranilate isomerase [Eubacterium sp.]
MNKTVVKICGFMREEDVEAAVHLGVDIIGFVVDYPVEVPWNLDKESAKKLIGFFKKCRLRYSSGSKCCIVSGGSSEKLIELSKELEVDYLQMHYKEDAEAVKLVSAALHRAGIKLIKTVPGNTDELLRQSGKEKTAECAAVFEDMGADILLVDSRGPENAASQGIIFDDKLYEEVRKAVNIPVMLAGGITADNVASLLESIRPDMIDLMTGVEESPGVKSGRKLEEFMRNAATG